MFMTNGRRTTAIVAGLAALALGVTACGGSSASSTAGAGGSASPAGTNTLTLYNAQHEDLMQQMVDGFTKQTGIKVQMRNGSDSEMANQIIQEGNASPADVFVTENSPAMTLVDSKAGFSKLGADTLSQVPARYAPADGNWVGFAARSTVLAYNSKQLKPAQLPASLLDLAKPEWKGKFGFSPNGADFQAIVSAVVAVSGEPAATQWLKGLKENGKIYQGNSTVMKAVNRGEIQAGVIYHYYWYKDRAESGANSKDVELHLFGKKDPGAFISISGAGVLKSSKHQAEAQQLVKYLTSKDGQQVLASSKALEYTVGNGVAANAVLKPLSEIDAPDVPVADLNGPKVIEMMQQAGLL
jgi:iron(III) transport system substrate-binding protein